MKEIKLTITGNQENKKGNPIPYYRVTSQSKFSDGTKRYHAWKGYVVATLIDWLDALPKEKRAEYKELIDFTDKKPIKATADKIHMRLCITWADKKHGDCDNVFKGIADALFMNDKYVSGAFDYHYGDQAKVDVTITFL